MGRQGGEHVVRPHTALDAVTRIGLDEVAIDEVRGVGRLGNAEPHEIFPVLVEDIHPDIHGGDLMRHPALLEQAGAPAQTLTDDLDRKEARLADAEQGSALVGLLVDHVVAGHKHVAGRLVVVDEDAPEPGLLDLVQRRIEFIADLDGDRVHGSRRGEEHDQVAHAPPLVVPSDEVHLDQGVAQLDQIGAQTADGASLVTIGDPLGLTVDHGLHRLVEGDPLVAGGADAQAGGVQAQGRAVGLPAHVRDVLHPALHLAVLAAFALVGHAQIGETLALGAVEVKLDAHRNHLAGSEADLSQGSGLLARVGHGALQGLGHGPGGI